MPVTALSDAELLEQARNGDEAAPYKLKAVDDALAADAGTV